jgi:MoaA/NifB/PqqE/SkfB family radical SAM enzyme
MKQLSHLDMDTPFAIESVVVSRLVDDYNKYGELLIGLDFDNTIFDCHNKGYTFNKVVNTIKEAVSLGCRVVVITARKGDRDIAEVEQICADLGIEIAGINIQLIQEFAGIRKIFVNIQLDDRAGLGSALKSLDTALLQIKRSKS